MNRGVYEVLVAENVSDYYTEKTDLNGDGITFNFYSCEEALTMAKFALDQGYEAKIKKFD